MSKEKRFLPNALENAKLMRQAPTTGEMSIILTLLHISAIILLSSIPSNENIRSEKMFFIYRAVCKSHFLLFLILAHII